MAAFMNEAPFQFRVWLVRLLHDGEAVLPARPVFAPREPEAAAELHSAFNRRALDIAGPEIGFDPDVAFKAARTVAAACWRAASGETEPALEPIGEPRTPAAHLSADLTLRFLPPVFRRAKAQDAEGTLAQELERFLRTWPLSGVLADLDGEPIAPADGAAHMGLQVLYAERFAATRHPGWLPPAGPSREWVERVFAERRLSVPAPPTEPRREDSCPTSPPPASDDTPSNR
jgi:hypothetical protein